jgi:hypothetical protein
MRALLEIFLRLLGVTKRRPASDVAVLVAGGLVGLAIRKVTPSIQRWRSEDWPRTRGTLQPGVVNRFREPGPAAVLPYLYSVGGNHYAGQYRLRAKSGRAAQQELERLKGQSVVVRYKPTNPTVSLVIEDDNSFLQAH